MIFDLTDVQRLKFALLADGLVISPSAQSPLHEALGSNELSSHDFASTSGIILRLEQAVWVNAPISLYNPNFVSSSPYTLDYDNGFYVFGNGFCSLAEIWKPPRYHDSRDLGIFNFVVTHGDRARLSPIRSCAMVCDFCNIPFDDPIDLYRLKSAERLMWAAKVAIDDALQPAQHILISGGTPKPKDAGWLRELYLSLLDAYREIPIDIMMVPLPGLLNFAELSSAGLNEVSINIEVFGRDRARQLMRNKFNFGLDSYLSMIDAATQELGPGRVRSMLMVGLEPVEDTLAGVRAIAERGAIPVLSPFRPDPSTPLRNLRPPSASVMERVYIGALEIAERYGVGLGPTCPPCTHNTISFAPPKARPEYPFRQPNMISAL